MANVVWFKDLNKDSISVAGGKGANLGEMFNLGLPIPSGFMVSAQAYKSFIEQTKIKDKILEMLKKVDIDDTNQLQNKTAEIRELIENTGIPEEIRRDISENYELVNVDRGHDANQLVHGESAFVAVRSSATAEDLPEASFAGQQATFLNVKGSENLIRAVRKCWASLFTARAVYYREKNNFPHDKVLIAVVVQKMVNSARSGIMFTANPATNNDKEIVIEAGWGLGEAVVSGSINPDLYIVDKGSFEIKKRELKKQVWGLFRNKEGNNEKRKLTEEIEAKQVISDEQIVALAKYGKKIEDHYGKPQDIEWAEDANVLYIVQSRAITTLKREFQESTENNQTGRELIRGETASPGVGSGKVKIIFDIKELDKIQKGDVLVTAMTTPDMVPAMQRAVAIVTDEGGLTCHAAIVSREMGVPCIVGTENATKVLKEGMAVTVHATHGIVYEGITAHREERHKIVEAVSEDIITATEVKLVLDLPDLAEKFASTDADGIGLVRLEIMIAQGKVHPAEFIRQNRDQDYVNLLAEGIRKMALAFKGKPVWVRNSDIRTDEYRNLEGGDKEPKETDPMIGWHAIRRLLDEPRILKAEFQAVKKLHDEGLTNVGVMLPFVIRVDEIRQAKKILREVGLDAGKNIDFGVMIETPASCWIIEDICKEGVDFVSFGTNDLTQLTLGIDRNNQRIAKLFDEMHPSVLGELSKVIQICKKYGVKTSICGQAGSRPEMAEFLVYQGIDSISTAPDAVHDIRRMVAKTERKLLLDAERAKNK